jgi:hypothetical protein
MSLLKKAHGKEQASARAGGRKILKRKTCDIDVILVFSVEPSVTS